MRQRSLRSDSVIDKIEQEVIELLKTTKLSCSAIGKLFGLSRGPIWKIKSQNNIVRANPRLKREVVACYHCKENFYPRAFKKKINKKGLFYTNKFCSKKCYTFWQMSEENRGANNPGWIDSGKHEAELNALRKRPEWKSWRDKVYNRDSFICQNCFQKGGKLHPHHILYKSEYPEKIFDLDNGITLCVACHLDVHFYKCKDKIQYRDKFQILIENKKA